MTLTVRPFGAMMRALLLLLGLLTLANTADAACATPTGAAGDMTYSTSANVMAYCDGTNWVSMAGGVSLTVNTAGGGDNLGDHTATQDLNMSGYNVNSGLNATFTGLGNFGSLLTGGLTVTGQASITTISATLIQVGSGGGASCSSNINGALRYNSPSSTLEICTGTTWTGLASGTITGSGISGGSATAIAFWNGPNSLTYESATTTGLYWDHPNGRLGVGTNSPSNSLHVIGGAGQGNAMILEANVSGGYSGNALQFRRGIAPSTTGWAIGGDVPGSNPTVMTDDLIFSSFSGVLPWVERMRIVSGTGYVGIANGSPTATLQVSGTFIVSQTNQNSLASASLAVDSRGVSVSSIIHINGSPGAAMGAGSNQIVSGTTNVTAYSAGSVTITTNGSQKVVVDNTGRVGIGTNAPTYNLMVSGTTGLSVTNGEKSIALEMGGGANDIRSWNAPLYINSAASNPSNTFINPVGGYASVGATTSWNISDGVLRVKGIPGASAAMLIDGNTTANWVNIRFANSNGSVGTITTNGTATAYNTSSDRRVKENITVTREGLQNLMRLPVRDFVFRNDSSHTIVTGFIAQELDKVFPEAVTTNGDDGKVPLKNTKDIWQVDYGRVTPLIVKAVQDLKRLFDTDHSDIAKLKAANDNLERRVEALEMELNRMNASSR